MSHQIPVLKENVAEVKRSSNYHRPDNESASRMPKQQIACLYTLISTETEIQHVKWQQKTAINSIYFHICIEIEVQSLFNEEVFLKTESLQSLTPLYDLMTLRGLYVALSWATLVFNFQ